MIITLIGLNLLVVGIILVILCKKKYFKNYNTEEKIICFGFGAITIGTLITLCSTVLILNNIITYDVEYQNTLYKKEMLEYRIEHMEENITGNEMLYNDIVEFNNMLRAKKKWANNPWTDWFNNKDIASIDYIELNE